MRTATLSEFLALNDQLAALVEADIPICVDLGPARGSFTESLERLNAAIARRMGQGASLTQALDEEPTVAPHYRTFVRLSLQHGDMPAALAGASRTATSVERTRQVWRMSLIYPLLVCGLAYVGIVLFCVYFVPTLGRLYASMGIARGSGLSILARLHETLPFWAPIPPLLLALFWMGPRLLRSTKVCRSSAAPLLGTATLVSEQQWADFAETLASLLEADTPQDEAVKLAAGALGDSPLRRELQRLPRDAGGETSRRVLISAAAGSPPFLRWALLDAAPSIETPRALRMAAGIYRDSAQRRLQRLAVLAPLVACVVIGGTATLLYGLALFVPVVHMLKAIAS